MTDSPIEGAFREAWDRLPIEDIFPGIAHQISIEEQVRVGPYRVDFLMRGFMGTSLVVECDGHDWHERSRAQARRDRDRDRTLLRAGLPVARYTGSQIHRSADACALDALETLSALALQRLGHHALPDAFKGSKPEAVA